MIEFLLLQCLISLIRTFASFSIIYSFQRYFMRQLTRKCTLYSEMVVAETILFSRYTEDITEYLTFNIIQI